ncbi:hypothetical protein [Rhizobium gallicum]|uniref:hypothetical protein n=1 Tax=Rhizobium gallicum TaxID=56730 RepID=UPI00035D10EA
MIEIAVEPQRPATFRDWTKGRAVQVIGTNWGSDELPFQNWRRFKEAFAPELIEQAVNETGCSLGRAVETILDPFGGSGTTALASQFLGVRPTTIEVNPFLTDLIEAKVASYDLDRAANLFGVVVEEVRKAGPMQEMWPDAPSTFVEPGKDGRYIFSRPVAEQIQKYIYAINNLPDQSISRLFRVLLGGIIISVSNVLVSGKGRRYRNKPNNVSSRDVDRLFKDRVLTALYDLRKFQHRPCADYTLMRGDARKLAGCGDKVDLSVFSPPYPNSFDYTDVYNVELWVLGYLNGTGSNRALREATIRSHVQIRRDMTSSRPSGSLLSKTVEALKAKRNDLWNVNLPEMIEGYVDDMCTVLEGVKSRLNIGGRIYMVVGDSRYAGVDIPVAKILAEAAPAIGLSVISAMPFRSMRASPQQGGRPELPETLIVLQG